MRRSRGLVLLLSAVFSFCFNTGLFALLYAYTWSINLATCLLFCNAVGDPRWRATWILAVASIAFPASFLFLLLQAKLVRGLIVDRNYSHYWIGAGLFTLIHSVTWFVIAEFKLLGMFQSYYGPA